MPIWATFAPMMASDSVHAEINSGVRTMDYLRVAVRIFVWFRELIQLSVYTFLTYIGIFCAACAAFMFGYFGYGVWRAGALPDDPAGLVVFFTVFVGLLLTCVACIIARRRIARHWPNVVYRKKGLEVKGGHPMG